MCVCPMLLKVALNLAFEVNNPSPKCEEHEEVKQEEIREGRTQTVMVLSFLAQIFMHFYSLCTNFWILLFIKL